MTALFIYFTATKATLGLVIPAVLIIMSIFNLWKKDFSYKETRLIFGLLSGALLLKFTMFQNAVHEIHYDYDITRSLAYALFRRTPFIKNYTDVIYPVYRFLSNFFRYLPQYVLNWPFLLFFILLSTNSGFRKKMGETRRPLVFIFIFFSISIIGGSLLSLPGAGDYFILYAQVIFIFLGMFALDYILSKDIFAYRFIAVLFLVSGMVTFRAELVKWIKTGWGELPAVKRRIWDERASINYGEWSAMKWLRNNSNDDELIFSDRRYFTHETMGFDVPRFYGYSVLSGRQALAEGECYLQFIPERYKKIVVERWALINQFLSSSDISEQINLLKNIKADYFIQSLRFNNADFSKINNLKLIYENDSIKIYKIIK